MLGIRAVTRWLSSGTTPSSDIYELGYGSIRKISNFSHEDQTMYVQYGCGFTAPPEWVNFDASPTLRWERTLVISGIYTKNSRRFPSHVRYGDIVKGLAVPEHNCQGVYASHVLEHLALDDFHRALDNTKLILRDGGIFRLVVPDLEWAAREYIRRIDAGDPQSNSFFLTETRLGIGTRHRRLMPFLYEWLGTSQHLWMWDAPSLVHALQQHGFRNVRRCCFGDCPDPMFALVESGDRFEHAVAVEGIG